MIDLRLGDCLEVMKDIPDGSVDAIITDPPYGTTACKWDSVIDFELMWEQLNRIIKPNGAIVLFGSEPFSSALRMSNIKNYKYDWVWDKISCSGNLLAKKQPLRAYELISVFYKKQPTYNPQLRDKPKKDIRKTNVRVVNKSKTHPQKDYNQFDKREHPKNKSMPTNVIRINNYGKSYKRKHPTQKPIALMEYLIKTYTNEGETVLDFTMGSGSTGVAAKNLNRNFIGIEQDQKYFNIAEQRIKETEFKLF